MIITECILFVSRKYQKLEKSGWGGRGGGCCVIYLLAKSILNIILCLQKFSLQFVVMDSENASILFLNFPWIKND